MKFIALIIFTTFSSPASAEILCNLLTHENVSEAVLAKRASGTVNFFPDESDLTLTGLLTISGSYIGIEYNNVLDEYKCSKTRNDACVREVPDEKIIAEARVDLSMKVVVQMERQVFDFIDPFSRGGVADETLRLWKIISCY